MATHFLSLKNVEVFNLTLTTTNQPFIPSDAQPGAEYLYADVKLTAGTRTYWRSYLDLPKEFEMNGRIFRKTGFNADMRAAHYQGNKPE